MKYLYSKHKPQDNVYFLTMTFKDNASRIQTQVYLNYDKVQLIFIKDNPDCKHGYKIHNKPRMVNCMHQNSKKRNPINYSLVPFAL